MTLRDFDAIAARATKDKACGPDSLNLFIIRNLPRSWHSLYVDAVNDIIVGGMPAHYNSVEVTMLFKGGDPFLLSSYRPLMVGTVLYKLLSSYLRNFISRAVEEAGILSWEQKGFRRGCSGDMHLWKLAGALQESDQLHVFFLNFFL